MPLIRFARHIKQIALAWLFICLLSTFAMAQQILVKGVVSDAVTHEVLPFVHVIIPNTQIGAVTDMDGSFQLHCPQNTTMLQFSTMGYDNKFVNIPKNHHIKVALHPSAINLQTVEISAKRTKTRYRRKDNPAVELMQQVVAHKEQNRLSDYNYYRKRYTKTSMALDDFHPDFQRHFLWKHLPFIEDYLDITPFDNTEILNISVSETMAEQHHQEHDSYIRTLVTARRQDGVAAIMESEGINEGPTSLFMPVDIYANEIELLENRFVSPLANHLANAVYHYYITDTIEVDGIPCVELSFSPANKSDYAFFGRVYVVMDSTYAIKKVDMSVSKHANINFVRSFNIIQNYQRDSLGRYLPERSDTYGRLALTSKINLLKQLYIHHTVVHYNYQFADSTTAFPDSLFNATNTTATSRNVNRMRRAEWNRTRPIELSEPELLVDSFRYELMRVPLARHAIHGALILSTGYIPTSSDRDSSRFDIGSIYNFYSKNSLEGVRLRFGGMTKATLNPRNFAEGYVAYGTADKHWKFNTTLTHTFQDHRHHANESPFKLISLNAKHDIESPGMAFEVFDRDNIFMQSTSRMMEYVSGLQLRFQHQWRAALSIDTRLSAQQHQPIGGLSYYRFGDHNDTIRVGQYSTYEWKTFLSFIPNPRGRETRGGSNVSGNKKNTFSLSLEHNMGLFEGTYYNSTQLRLRKVLWLTPLGFLDLKLNASKVWNQVPLPKLFFPLGNASNYLGSESFNTMAPMEFATDQNISLFATYHMRGLIFNHLPFIRRFKLREVASFNLCWGSLSNKNNPALGHPSLYLMPTQTQSLTAMPFMEFSVGVENIFHFMRIDYVHRLSYLTPNVSHNGIRIGLELSL